MHNSHYYAVIMAGGGGTRLWPLSRQARPKQMLSLFDERTLFQIAVERLDGLFPPERICVVTVAEQAQELQKQCPQIPLENYLIEPKPRGTASVVGLAAAVLGARDPQASMAVLTADHFIGNVGRFQQLLRAADLAAAQGWLVTLGIAPTYAATGYGYIQVGEPVTQLEEMSVHRALRFKEKPAAEAAEAMWQDGQHAWNSGMFVWRVAQIMAEFRRQMPDLTRGLEQIAAALGTPAERQVVAEVWEGLRSETIDYGIMEGAERVAVIPAAGLGWSDVGSWESLFEVLPADEHGNIVREAQFMGLDTHNTLIYGQPNGRLVVTIGVQDLVVVDTGDVLLVCPRAQAQQVRQVVAQLKQGGQQYL